MSVSEVLSTIQPKMEIIEPLRPKNIMTHKKECIATKTTFP
jgi:hypothetical protein